MVTQNRQLRFSWSDIGKCVRKGTFKFTVQDNPKNEFQDNTSFIAQDLIKVLLSTFLCLAIMFAFIYFI